MGVYDGRNGLGGRIVSVMGWDGLGWVGNWRTWSMGIGPAKNDEGFG